MVHACTVGEGRAGSAWVEHWGPGVAAAAHALPRALQNGSTPLHKAAYNGKTDTVEVLLQHKEAMAEVKAEQESMCPDEESLNYANLLAMDGMRRAITETLRLYPPLILLMRKVMKDNFKVGHHTIPKGDVVGLCAPASNLDPRYWSDATEFKPQRYLPGAAEADTFDSRSVSLLSRSRSRSARIIARSVWCDGCGFLSETSCYGWGSGQG